VQLRLCAAHPVRRRRPGGRPGAVPGTADHRRGGALPAGGHAADGRRGRSPDDLTRGTLAQIAHFFEHYKDLESGKWVKVLGWAGADAAGQEIIDGVKGYQQASRKPNF
jgi:inorganic pyrophosphatase